MSVRMLSTNIGLFGRFVVLALAFVEWLSVVLFVYSLERFSQKFLVKLSAAAFAILCVVGVVIAQRELYQPANSARFSVNEFDVVVISECTVTLFILFRGLLKLRYKGTPDRIDKHRVP